MADEAAGVVTTGPYRLVRHPIFLGFSMLALGQALAFASWPAVLVVFAAWFRLSRRAPWQMSNC
jgi:protein-S-isoprenylcysteine O-methyltransferase Ste14